MSTTTVLSSMGELYVNRETGFVEGGLLNDETQPDLKDIKRFDISEFMSKYGIGSWEKVPGRIDILDLGYWIENGTYVEPCHDWRAEYRRTKK